MCFGFLTRLSAAIFFCVCITGCAKVSVDRVTSDSQPGIRYWRPAHYLSLAPVTTGTTVTCEAKLIELPDKSEQYAITMNAGMGTAEATPTLQDGWNLTAMTSKADSKTAENITAISALVSKLAPGGLMSIQANTPIRARAAVPNCSGFYRLHFAADGQLDSFDPVPLPAPLVVVIPGAAPAPPKDPKNCGGTGQPKCTG